MANREHKPYPKHKRIALLSAELRWFVSTLNIRQTLLSQAITEQLGRNSCRTLAIKHQCDEKIMSLRIARFAISDRLSVCWWLLIATAVAAVSSS